MPMQPANDFLIGSKTIGELHMPFIIAEMSGNHNQSLERALSIVDAAALSGVHALKIQTYTADTLTLNLETSDFYIEDKTSLWQGNSLYKLYELAYTPWEWHAPIFERCKKHGILCFSTPFDESAVDFLEKLDVPAFKIASFENIHLPLIRKVAETGKPVIISTGMATVGEIEDAVNTARSAGCKDLVLLKCTSSYPATPENSNIRTLSHLKKLFNCHVGLSDHTMGIGASVAAVAMGARVIEKHFTLNRADGGVDSTFSLEPEEMKSLVIETERAFQALGEVRYGPLENEKKSLIFRRSIYITDDIRQGEIFTAKNLRIIRPGYGLAPKYYDQFIGKQAKHDIKKGTPLSWDLI